MKRLMTIAFAGLAATAMAAKIIITSYNVPHEYPLAETSEVQFDPSGLFITVSDKAKTPNQTNRYFLGNSNSLKIDTSIKAVLNFKNSPSVELVDVDSFLTFAPPADSSGDKDADGLSNFDELMVYHTDPNRADTDGDGLSDGYEAGRFNPLIADIPSFSIGLPEAPQMYVNLTNQSSVTTERAITTSKSWGADEGSTRSLSNTNRDLDEFNFSLAGEIEPVAFVMSKVTITSGYKHEWETSTEVASSTERRKSYNDQIDELNSRSETDGTEITGGKLVVAIRLTNTSHLGITLSDLTYNLYGVKYVNGTKQESIISTLPANLQSHTLSLSPGESVEFQLTDNAITIQELNDFGKYQYFKVGISGHNTSYDPTHSQPLKLSDVMTNVNAGAARIEIDFDGNLNNQESPMVRYVATQTKWVEEAKSYAPTYLGEILKNMNVAYELDGSGFGSIKGLANDSRRKWRVIQFRKGLGGAGFDTISMRLGKSAGPDSVIVNANDAIFIAYSGDVDGDSVPDYIERMVGTFSAPGHDFDGDKRSDYQEIYGWRHKGANKDTSLLFTNPRKTDSDDDGDSDYIDPYPLRSKSLSECSLNNLKYISSQGVEGTLNGSSDFKLPVVSRGIATFKTIDEKEIDFGASVNFRIQLTGAPLIAEILVDGIKKVNLVRDSTERSRIVYVTKTITGVDSTYNLGNPNEITLHLVSMDRTSNKEYILYDKAAVGRVDNGVKNVTLDGVKPWKTLAALIDVKAQLQAEPRTTGILVYRLSGSNKGFSAPVLGNSIRTPAIGPVLGSESIRLIAAIEGDAIKSGIEYLFVDSAETRAGTSYSYFTIPFVKSGAMYYFGGASLLSQSVTTKKIRIKSEIPLIHCINENDGAGDAEIKAFFKYSRKSPSKEWVILKDTAAEEGSVGDNQDLQFKVEYADSALQEDDSIDVYIRVTEVDGGEGDSNGDDDNWNTSFVKLTVRQLLNLISIDQPAENGWIFYKSADNIYKSMSTLNVPNLPYPTKSNQTIISWYGNEWDGVNSAADSDIEMKFNLSWWIE